MATCGKATPTSVPLGDVQLQEPSAAFVLGSRGDGPWGFHGIRFIGFKSDRELPGTIMGTEWDHNNSIMCPFG